MKNTKIKTNTNSNLDSVLNSHTNKNNQVIDQIDDPTEIPDMNEQAFEFKQKIDSLDLSIRNYLISEGYKNGKDSSKKEIAGMIMKRYGININDQEELSNLSNLHQNNLSSNKNKTESNIQQNPTELTNLETKIHALEDKLKSTLIDNELKLKYIEYGGRKELQDIVTTYLKGRFSISDDYNVISDNGLSISDLMSEFIKTNPIFQESKTKYGVGMSESSIKIQSVSDLPIEEQLDIVLNKLSNNKI